MGILRSETMVHGVMILPTGRARDVMNALGHVAPVQFEDSMEPGSLKLRPYRRHVQRVEDTLRIVRSLLADVERIDPDALVKGREEHFLCRDQAGQSFDFDEQERRLQKLHVQFQFFRKNNDLMTNEFTATQEEKYVCQLARTTNAMSGTAIPDSKQASLLGHEGGMRADSDMTFSNVAGTILTADAQKLARQVFRATRGNTYTIVEGIEETFYDTKLEKDVHRSVFSIYFQGSVSSAMSDKVLKICQAMGCSMYEWPRSAAEADRRLEEIGVALRDKEKARAAYTKSMAQEAECLTQINALGGNSYLYELLLFLEKEKSIFTTLDLFDGVGQTISTKCWYPAMDEARIRTALEAEAAKHPTSGVLVREPAGDLMPPTYIRRNEFNDAFQELIDTYGCAGYKEANPGMLTCVTFPFIFGIMYGDVFHGGCLFLLGLYVCLNANKIKYSTSELWQGLYFGRYLILMMGFFAVYAGFLYNDFLSLGLNLFPSRWVQSGMTPDGKEILHEPLYDVKNEGGLGPYPFGLDPAWIGAQNELLFVNSMKMKISVLIGVIQMTVGVFLRFGNAIFNSNYTDLFCECIPMLIFMVCFFGYMDYMILYKWVHPTTTNPSLINSLISMGLGQPDKAPLYEGQADVQGKLMILVAVSIPWLLLPKPLILYWKSKQGGSSKVAAVDEEAAVVHTGGSGHHGEFDAAEVVIHQVIETIEYVLGTVSHTASYLRQWALSLAHQQLSMVFFQKTMVPALASGSAVQLYLSIAVFMAITAGVLLGMDVLECFLHTLRLHWVEFQSKFFKADGYWFTPFNHAKTLKTA